MRLRNWLGEGVDRATDSGDEEEKYFSVGLRRADEFKKKERAS